ncbi:MAG: hypothetical protein V7733_02735 [Paraglaciecola polaris]|uniref:hypothetical protein n=1 Tax=Paraglaciecola polaris TaxID=222814 RepID=UPI0030029E8B|tara:strand:- start:5335 stop:5883 length:549 start_codon:yes stop_codon:yes gene_type:complete
MNKSKHVTSKTSFLARVLLVSLILGVIQVVNVTVMASTEIHEHKALDIGEGTPIPKIELSAYRDPLDGVNIHVEIDNYLLNAPNLAVNTPDNKVGGILQGHAHVFVNGIKRQRLYGKDVHIPQSWLEAGVNQVAISLNSHQHENWMSGDHNIVGSVFLDLSKKQIVLHNFTSQPIENKHAHH